MTNLFREKWEKEFDRKFLSHKRDKVITVFWVDDIKTFICKRYREGIDEGTIWGAKLAIEDWEDAIGDSNKVMRKKIIASKKRFELDYHLRKSVTGERQRL